MTSPAIVAAVPPPLMQEFFSAEDLTRLKSLAAAITTGSEPFRRVDRLRDVPDRSATQIVITSWGAEPFTARVLDEMPRLRLIAHSGATIRPLVTDEVFDRGIPVTQAGAAMARSVAEVSLAFTLALLHRIPQLHDGMRNPAGWYSPETAGVQHEIFDAPIAVIGASRTGRAFIELIRALGARPVLLCDPTISATDARGLGAELTDLDDALSRARITALHAPTLPETHHMIAARELSLMPDGAGLVNTARSWLVDEEALIRELRSARLCAAIDVFDEEPLASDSPLRTTPGTLLTPHRAAGTAEGRLRQGRLIVDEISALLEGRPLQHAIDRDRLALMA